MTDMFIPKKEKIIITIEAVIYVLCIILASYFTICGNLFLRMIPLIYILGIFGVIAFDKPTVTVILSCISTIVFGFMVEQEISWNVILFSIYSVLMVICGEITGHILNLFYENFKLRKFIKHYNKIICFGVLIISIALPVFLNNIVSSNMLSYSIAKNKVNKYITENYAYNNYYIEDVKYIPSYHGGVYEFNVMLDGVLVKLDYSKKDKVSDSNMDNRKENLSKIANAEINIMLKENKLTNLDVVCTYDYSKIASIPDIIRLNISNIKSSEIDKVLEFIDILKDWDKYIYLDRINIVIDNINVSLTKQDLEEKNITKEYLQNGMNFEILSNKEGK